MLVAVRLIFLYVRLKSSELRLESAMSKDSSGKPHELSSGGSRYHQVYPTLDERQLAILERYGERRKLKANDILYSEGDRHIAMFAILS